MFYHQTIQHNGRAKQKGHLSGIRSRDYIEERSAVGKHHLWCGERSAYFIRLSFQRDKSEA